jgi:hypothetical protein
MKRRSIMAWPVVFALCCDVSFAQTNGAPAATEAAPPVIAPAITSPVLPGATRPQDIGPALRKTNEEARTISGNDVLNPFTGGSAQYEQNARVLQLERQRTAILREKQNQAQSLSDMGRMVNLPAQPGATLVATPPNALASVPAVAPDAAAPRRLATRPPRTTNRVVPSKRSLAATAAATPVALPPPTELVGVAMVDGKRYALVNRSGEQFSVAEHGELKGVRVGAVSAGDAEVDGNRQQVNLNRQEIVVHPATKPAPPSAIAPATAPLSPPPIGGVATDMRTLRLPTIPAPSGEALGPQPYPGGTRTQ